MDEMYRMLGREHEADLEHDAVKWRRADEVRRAATSAEASSRPRPARRGPALVVALLARAARWA
jgi:hypothetical protein